MIAKNIKGKSFKGCVSYVMNEGATLLEAEGVWAETNQDIIRSFAIQRSGRREIKQPVGHIPIAFSPEDKDRMTNEFILKLAKEYMQEMGIRNTQYIIVRHHNTDNEHLHIVYNRVDNDLKLISVNNDYKRNIKVCKKLKDKYSLTYGKGKENIKREKLNDPDKVKYQIYDAIKAALPYCKKPTDLKSLLKQSGIETVFKLKRTTGDIEGISFKMENICFKGSEIDRKFSYANLEKEFQKNIEKEEIRQKESAPSKRNRVILGVKLNDEQEKILLDGGCVFLENMNRTNGSGQFSAYVFLNDEKNKVFFSTENPDEFVKYGNYKMRIRDKIQVENGFITKAKVKWWGCIDYQYPYLWKEKPSDPEYRLSWGDPKKAQEEKAEKMPELRQNLSNEVKQSRGRKM